ncbi:MAG: SPO1 DNA polymerase [Candidatus Muproteobacteria bacterium RBG_16_60_9]|uniref:Type-5 uracil-DNA glycosylase n=1 Tax=Candidatus Muproteobacteria bacterium RBG_16_60_9 TaxID=1817755 RepID=A0A1F6V4Y2_9PROT|nr:MAG: SPO1 DNA polymerase [Candidatus Muproteobacteria bacterium RBG_16_60_9]
MNLPFNKSCRACPRLARHLAGVRREHCDYHARPVAPFGDARARLLIVGLAPGMHGANRTGRPFTGDHAGILLYQMLHRHGFANQPNGADPRDGLRLIDCRITNAVKCLPPENKPLPEEVVRCNRYLRAELERLPAGAVVLALGAIAHGAVLRAHDLKLASFPFGHGKEYLLPSDLALFDSYHCSRYNTQTRRLTPRMFSTVVRRVRARLSR